MAQIKLNESNGRSCQVFNKMPLNMNFRAITFFFFCLNQCMYNLLGMLPNFALVFHGHLLFFCFVDFFLKNFFHEYYQSVSIWIQIRPDVLSGVGTDHDPNCLQRLSAASH